MTSSASNFYVFKCDEFFDKWKRVIYVFMALLSLFLLIFIVTLATGAVDINTAASIFGRRNFAQALIKPYGDVPGVTFLNKGYNMLDGYGFDSAYSNVIGEFTRKKGKTVSVNGVVGFEPDQISVTTNPRCDTFKKRSAVFKAGSFGVVAEYAHSISYGGVFSLGDANDSSTTESMHYEMAYAFGNSKMIRASLGFYGSKYSDEFIVWSDARLMDAKVSWIDADVPFNYRPDFVAGLKKLSGRFRSDAKRNKAVFKFAGRYGTHVIERAEFGAMCHTCVVTESLEGGIGGSLEATTAEVEALAGFGFEVSKTSATRVGVEFSLVGGKKGQIAYTSCDGLLNGNPCDSSMNTGIDEPVVTRLKLLPIGLVKINGINNMRVNINVRRTLKSFYKALIKCSYEQCHGSGGCVVRTSFWSDYEINNWNGRFDDYSAIFDADICIDWS